MVFGKTDEEEIPINEDTYWSGGPYSTTVEGGYRALPGIQRLIFDGELVRAHKAFGRHLMGYPVEQQKYQALGSVWLRFPGSGEVTGYRHQLDLDTAIATTRYEQGGVAFTREVFASPVDQVIVVRLVADQPGRSPSGPSSGAPATRPTRTTPPTTSAWTAWARTASSCGASPRTTSACAGPCATRPASKPWRRAAASASRTTRWSWRARTR